jgi:hypothetical protein
MKTDLAANQRESEQTDEGRMGEKCLVVGHLAGFMGFSQKIHNVLRTFPDHPL